MSLPPAKSSRHGALVFDLAERGFLLALAVQTVFRLTAANASDPQVALILTSEGLGVIIILLRKPALRANFSPYATGVAFLGTAAPLLVIAPKGATPLIPVILGFWVMVAGLLLNISAKVALNRSFGLAAANRGVKREGPYRFLRHPMYAGYATTQIAFLLLHPYLWNLAVYALAWTLQILRIHAEEQVLLDDPAYRAYADKVRFRLAPGLY
jgi:protein-S-isoprenylcysteine O-methyltransferase Ste14